MFPSMVTLWSVMLCLFSPYVMLFERDNQQGILSYQFDNYLAVHEEPELITYFRTYRSAWTVLYLIDRLLCMIQSNQTLDALIK